MNNDIININESIVEKRKFRAFEEALDLESLEIVGIEYKNKGIQNYGTRLKSKKLQQKLIENHYEINVILKDSVEKICKKCGSKNINTKDNEKKYYELDKIMGMPAWLVYHRKQCRCGHCGSNVYGECKDLIKRQYTANLLMGIMEKLGQVRSRASIAREYDVPETLVKEINDALPEDVVKLGPVLCMDEFKGNLDNLESEWKDKYQTILADGRNRRIIDILPTRQYKDLVEYFSKIPEEERKKVKYCISDMSPIFIGIFKKFFSHAKIIIDRFHYTRLIVEAFNDIRKSLQDSPTYKNLDIKRMQKLFIKNANEIKSEKFAEARGKLAKVFKKCPQLKQAYDILQEFYEFNQSKDREVARTKLKKLKEKVENLEGYKELKKAMRSIDSKSKYVLNSFLIKETNSYAEGYNNFIKVLKRVSYGCKNLLRFKKRIMYIQLCYKEYKSKKIANKELINKIS